MLRYADIYALAVSIPPGKVASYGQIAAMLGHPKAGRMVGQAMARCNCAGVPCHRVVSARGGLSEGFSPMGRATHRALLEMEGVSFTQSGNVDMQRHRYIFPGAGSC